MPAIQPEGAVDLLPTFIAGEAPNDGNGEKREDLCKQVLKCISSFATIRGCEKRIESLELALEFRLRRLTRLPEIINVSFRKLGIRKDKTRVQ